MNELEELFEEAQRKMYQKGLYQESINEDEVNKIIKRLEVKLLDYIEKNRVTERMIPQIEGRFAELGYNMRNLNNGKIKEISNVALLLLRNTQDSTEEIVNDKSPRSEEEKNEEIGTKLRNPNYILEDEQSRMIEDKDHMYIEDCLKDTYRNIRHDLARAIEYNPELVSHEFIEELGQITTYSCREGIEKMTEIHDGNLKKLVEEFKEEFNNLGEKVIKVVEQDKNKEQVEGLKPWDLEAFGTNSKEVNGNINNAIQDWQAKNSEAENGLLNKDYSKVLPTDAIK